MEAELRAVAFVVIDELALVVFEQRFVAMRLGAVRPAGEFHLEQAQVEGASGVWVDRRAAVILRTLIVPGSNPSP